MYANFTVLWIAYIAYCGIHEIDEDIETTDKKSEGTYCEERAVQPPATLADELRNLNLSLIRLFTERPRKNLQRLERRFLRKQT